MAKKEVIEKPKNKELEVGQVVQYGNEKNLRYRVVKVLKPIHSAAETRPDITYELFLEKTNKFTVLE